MPLTHLTPLTLDSDGGSAPALGECVPVHCYPLPAHRAMVCYADILNALWPVDHYLCIVDCVAMQAYREASTMFHYDTLLRTYKGHQRVGLCEVFDFEI